MAAAVACPGRTQRSAFFSRDWACVPGHSLVHINTCILIQSSSPEARSYSCLADVCMASDSLKLDASRSQPLGTFTMDPNGKQYPDLCRQTLHATYYHTQHRLAGDSRLGNTPSYSLETHSDTGSLPPCEGVHTNTHRHYLHSPALWGPILTT